MLVCWLSLKDRPGGGTTMSSTTKKALPEANGDFYAIGTTISEEDQALLRRVRAFLEAEVAPRYQ
jgi:hypothetical protein